MVMELDLEEVPALVLVEEREGAVLIRGFSENNFDN